MSSLMVLLSFLQKTLQYPIKREFCSQKPLLANVQTKKRLAKNRLLFDKLNSLTSAI
jgi:hypothetical protein